MSTFTEDALRIIRDTRKITLPHYGNVEHKEKRNAADVVTKVDFQVEEFLTRELTALDTSIGFVGEEYGGDRTCDTYWLVDPIDGTMHFVRGIPFCTTMIALIRNNRVVFSVIYDFVTDILFHAEREVGAFQNGNPIHVSERPFSHSVCSIETQSNKDANNELYTRVRGISKTIKTVSAGYEFALLATGKIEGRIAADPYGKDYDFAPGSLLVQEAGGVVENIGKTTYDFRDLNFIAGNKLFVTGLTEGPGALLPHGKETW